MREITFEETEFVSGGNSALGKAIVEGLKFIASSVAAGAAYDIAKQVAKDLGERHGGGDNTGYTNHNTGA